MARECGVTCGRTRHPPRRHMCLEELENECYE